jgi:hypothetical protein
MLRKAQISAAMVSLMGGGRRLAVGEAANRGFNRTPRRRVALLGVVAILFQAILFGWHHHPLVLASHGVQPVAHGQGGAPLSPTTAEDDCDICQPLHNLSASPVEFTALAPPAAAAVVFHLLDLASAGRDFARAFQARAPPRA